MNTRFEDRRDAGRNLAAALKHHAGEPGLQILALPRGGLPVGYEVALALSAPLRVFVVRKLGVPGHEEFAMGAIASGGIRFLNNDVIQELGLSRGAVEDVIAREEIELQRREFIYGASATFSFAGKPIILVDDGLATGSSMRAAIAAVGQQRPSRVTVAVPVAAPSICRELEREREVDEVVCVKTPDPFYAVGEWYQDFSQTSDEEVRTLLQRADERVAAGSIARKLALP